MTGAAITLALLLVVVGGLLVVGRHRVKYEPDDDNNNRENTELVVRLGNVVGRFEQVADRIESSLGMTPSPRDSEDAP